MKEINYKHIVIILSIIMLCLTLFDGKRTHVQQNGRRVNRSATGDAILNRFGFKYRYLNQKV